jgi:3-methyladenine DNA glycosylase AlkD
MVAKDADIKKAVAWTLREISKREPEMVNNFLKSYQDSPNKNTQWIMKQGSKKL